MPIDNYRLANRANWDSRVDIHYSSDEYGVERFIADPGHLSDVVSFDRHKLPDLTGRSLVHLQCHIGTDTISLARLGAEVTGVDFSEKSIEAARRLSVDSGTPARFVVAELYEAPQLVGETFDVVYTGVGAICWLPDIRGWAKVVAALLEPGGRFYMREGHPVQWALDYDNTAGFRFRYPYFEVEEPDEEIEEVTYAGEGTLTSPTTYGWNHGMGETLQALIKAGLHIDRVEEYDFCDWQAFELMTQVEGGRWALTTGREQVPLMWSVLATKS